MRRRKAEQKRAPRITHDQVVELLVDYHLGRLPPATNRAIEAHVASCPLCQIQDLDHTVTEKRAVQRRIHKVKPKRRQLISRRARIILLILTLIILVQLVIIGITRDHWFGSLSPSAPPAATSTVTAAPTQTALPTATATKAPTPTSAVATATPMKAPTATATP